ncbi:MAG: hypothetical protein HZA91_17600 [Verrucomicrobia bacterium]|nr:hypothetical protein [Verrucomicrobiota bacterium]
MNFTTPSCRCVHSCFAAALCVIAARAAELKSGRFDRDPGWEGLNNRLEATQGHTVTQDFGFSPATRFAGGKPGEIGGRVTRTPRLAFYAARLPARTLNDRLSASGAFTFTETGGSCGVFVGWFNARQAETARPTNALGMNFGAEKTGSRLAIRLINSGNESCGAPVTKQDSAKGKKAPALRRGVRYEWTLAYDPAANGGNGQIVFTLSGFDRGKDPIQSPVTLDLPPGFKQKGATFDRFGIVNVRKAGHALAVYLDDLTLDGKTWDFAADPQWEGVGNRETYAETQIAGAHNFGYSETSFAGGSKGEIGGIVWRSTFASYADKVGPLTLDQPLVARGRVAFTAADPDSGVYFGWFNSAAKDAAKRDFRNFIGVQVAGPTRVGHYFRPTLATAKGSKAVPEKGPLLRPDGAPHTWTFAYDPGRGAITVTLDNETATLNLRDKVRGEGAQLDRFGLLSPGIGGSKVKIWLDDLEYSASAPP